MLIFLHYLFLSHTCLFLSHYCMILHVILCLIISVYYLSIFLIPLMNFFMWFLVFYVVNLFLPKCTFHLNYLSVLVLSVSTKSNHYLICDSVMFLEPVNASVAPLHVPVNVVKSVPCNLCVSSSAKPMFINLNTVRSLNVCNAVKSASSAYYICRDFPVTHVISNHRQAFFLQTNVLPSSRTRFSPSYVTSNLRFSPLVIPSWNF